jgi:hypothetical protein
MPGEEQDGEPKESMLARLGSRLRALWTTDRACEIRYPTAPGEGPLPPAAMIKPTERQRIAVRNHRCDWP